MLAISSGYMLNLNHLALFHAVAKAGSVSLAAEQLMVSQPAVSKQLKQLELALKTELFDRHPRGVRLTDAGIVLADYTRRIFTLCDQAEAAVADVSSLRRGHLRLGATTTIGVYLLPQVLVHFRRRFPGVRLELEIENAAALLRRLTDDAINLALCETPIDHPDVEANVFMHDDMIAIAPDRHPLSRRRSVTAETFCGEPLITHQTTQDHPSLVERALAAKGLAVNPILSLSSTEAIKQAVAEGLGVAIVSHLAVKPDLASGRLSRIP